MLISKYIVSGPRLDENFNEWMKELRKDGYVKIEIVRLEKINKGILFIVKS